ncbi:hypothetical protein BDK92_2447 [Micromonospora pisi]|uniref:Uncharacterized protein n=1 Tax=Micromonospora pisi TaxID=589240 RepID=A0A495JGH8_9ACTN|nr:hypothetical protein BDK92_2447 [Micromonospora pisi]
MHPSSLITGLSVTTVTGERLRPPSPASWLGGGLVPWVDRASDQSMDMCTWSVWSLSPLYDCQPVAGNQICLYQIT